MDAPGEIRSRLEKARTASCVEIAVNLTKLHDVVVVQQSMVSKAGDGCYGNGNDDAVVLNSDGSDKCCRRQPRGGLLLLVIMKTTHQ